MKNPNSYVICSTPRSGTTLLCDLLGDTGVAGKPDSFFQFQSIEWWAKLLNTSMDDWDDKYSFDKEYLSKVLIKGKATTDIFGMRLMWSDLNILCNRLNELYPNLSNEKSRFQAAFGSTCFIHLSREDKVAQAVSRIKAEQSGLWHIDSEGNERERLSSKQTPKYDAKVILEQVKEYKNHDKAWFNWFNQQQIKAINITYEELSNDPQATLVKILPALALDTKFAKTVEPSTMKLANDESNKWIARFRAENVYQ